MRRIKELLRLQASGLKYCQMVGATGRIDAPTSAFSTTIGSFSCGRPGRSAVSRLAAFHRRYPAVEVLLQVANTRAVESGLIAGEIDIGFTEGVVANDQLEYTKFARDELVLIAAPDHPAVGRAPLPVSDLTQWPLLMHEVGSGTRAITERALTAKKLRVRPAMTLASGSAIKLVVASGAGLAFISSLAIRTELQAGRLVVVPVKQLRIERTLYRVGLRNASPGPSLDAFLEALERPSGAQH